MFYDKIAGIRTELLNQRVLALSETVSERDIPYNIVYDTGTFLYSAL